MKWTCIYFPHQLLCRFVCVLNIIWVASSSSYKLSPMRKKRRHVLADVSNAEASDVAHAATLLDPWLRQSPKQISWPNILRGEMEDLFEGKLNSRIVQICFIAAKLVELHWSSFKKLVFSDWLGVGWVRSQWCLYRPMCADMSPFIFGSWQSERFSWLYPWFLEPHVISTL